MTPAFWGWLCVGLGYVIVGGMAVRAWKQSRQSEDFSMNIKVTPLLRSRRGHNARRA